MRWLLYPFTLLYQWVTTVRNFLYDKGWRTSTSFSLPVISVGNLTVGGTGKTPHIAYLIALLTPHHNIATLSRGYGRATKGFVKADDKSTATTLGDEPLQFYMRYKETITVAVCESRVEGVKELIENDTPSLVLLDDAFQHRRIQPSLQILLMDYHRPFYEDFPFPMGRLRESRRGAQRADIIIVSKCPDGLNEKSRQVIEKSIQPYKRATTPVFFSGVQYGVPQRFDGKEAALATKVILVSGIAQPQRFEEHWQAPYTVVHHFIYKDHHTYTAKEVEQLIAQIEENTSVVCTEKDFVKLVRLVPTTYQKYFFFLPIHVYFLHEEAAFQQLIHQHLATFS